MTTSRIGIMGRRLVSDLSREVSIGIDARPWIAHAGSFLLYDFGWAGMENRVLLPQMGALGRGIQGGPGSRYRTRAGAVFRRCRRSASLAEWIPDLAEV